MGRMAEIMAKLMVCWPAACTTQPNIVYYGGLDIMFLWSEIKYMTITNSITKTTTSVTSTVTETLQ